jgi:thiamine-monophosphate kinase
MPDGPNCDDATIESVGEFGLIDRLARIISGTTVDPLQPARAGDIAIGDDAALWTPTAGTRQVLTTDALVEDVHFRLSTTSWRDLGWKALAENASDIAAMGALPTHFFVTLGLPRKTSIADLEELYRGMDDLIWSLTDQGVHGFAIAGGDTVSSPVTMLSVTVVGELCGEGLRRSAGKVGDLLAVTSSLGGSAGGLALLEAGEPRLDNPDVAMLVANHRRPWPRILEGLALVDSGVRCGMDLSDGLFGDSGKVACASGLSATLFVNQVPMPPALRRLFGERAPMMALAGGEDYELLVAAPPETIESASRALRERRLEPLTVVGRLDDGPAGKVTVLDEYGAVVDMGGGSWDHFRQAFERA